MRLRTVSGLTRLRSRSGVVAAVVTWLGLMVTLAALLASSQASARRQVAQRLEARTASGAEFASLYVRDVLARERRVAAIWLTGRRAALRSLKLAADAVGVRAALLLDREGRVLAVLPAKPALLGRIITGKYHHLAAAVAGTAAVSNVVPSAALGLPVVAFATPFTSPSGRRVFSGAFNVSVTPLGQYMRHLILTPGRRVYLVDETGGVIASSGAVPAGHAMLGQLDARLADRTRTQAMGSYSSARGEQSFVSVAVPGTPWRIVVAVPESQLDQSIDGFSRWLAWAAMISLMVAGLTIIMMGSWLLRSRHELDRLGRLDSLTSLRNRRDIEETLTAAISAAQRRQRGLTVLLIDVDHFKQVNDSLGHKAGDAVLINTGQAIRATMRTEDSLGRWGGEEFLAVLPDTDTDGAIVIADRIRAHVFAHVTVTVTIGVAAWRSGGLDELLARADAALYAGKAAGRNNVQTAAFEPPETLAAV